ncbi:hypothetical protein [Paraburkholderia hospita]|uniref:hypothetical protein n=1 Tax=Paraburkholderia hospita TaxID=169430 RepID=UPI003CC68CE8
MPRWLWRLRCRSRRGNSERLAGAPTEHREVRLDENGFVRVAQPNRYWDVSGRTFEDPDGYRVVLQNAR